MQSIYRFFNKLHVLIVSVVVLLHPCMQVITELSHVTACRYSHFQVLPCISLISALYLSKVTHKFVKLSGASKRQNTHVFSGEFGDSTFTI